MKDYAFTVAKSKARIVYHLIPCTMSESSASPVRKSQMGTTVKGSVATGWLPLGRPRGCSVSGGRRRGMLSKEKKVSTNTLLFGFCALTLSPRRSLFSPPFPRTRTPSWPSRPAAASVCPGARRSGRCGGDRSRRCCCCCYCCCCRIRPARQHTASAPPRRDIPTRGA